MYVNYASIFNKDEIILCTLCNRLFTTINVTHQGRLSIPHTRAHTDTGVFPKDVFYLATESFFFNAQTIDTFKNQEISHKNLIFYFLKIYLRQNLDQNISGHSDNTLLDKYASSSASVHGAALPEGHVLPALGWLHSSQASCLLGALRGASGARSLFIVMTWHLTMRVIIACLTNSLGLKVSLLFPVM